MNPAKEQRNEEIATRVLAGEASSQIAKEFDLSTTRIRQLVFGWFRRELRAEYEDLMKRKDQPGLPSLWALRHVWQKGQEGQKGQEDGGARGVAKSMPPKKTALDR